MKDSVFEPAVVTIPAGGSVRWTQVGAMPHTVTFDSLHRSAPARAEGTEDGMVGKSVITGNAGDVVAWQNPEDTATAIVFEDGAAALTVPSGGTAERAFDAAGTVAWQQTDPASVGDGYRFRRDDNDVGVVTVR